MSEGDFEQEGWSAFDDHGAHGEKGNAGCAFAILAVVILMPTIVAAATLAGATTMGILLAVVSLAISVAMGRRVLAK